MSVIRDFYEDNKNVVKEKERLDVLLANSLNWIYEHCENDDEYLKVLENHIEMTEEEIAYKSGI